jgi:glutamyl-Q tRNA(Asp) synthetase
MASPRYIGRFAPSPTGPLHFGSLVAALGSYLDARAAGGEWLVRIEDLDAPRSSRAVADDILRTLEAFGFEWQGEVLFQSENTARYESALARLQVKGMTYRCRCSRREIADSALRGIDGPVYPGTCRDLAIPGSTPAAVRIRTSMDAIAFEDRLQGPIAQRLATDIGDFVLKRKDGLVAYQLAVVVDDAEQGVTDVVRGADLLLSTPRQIWLQRQLELPTPRYLHLPVAINASGQKLSKQTLAPAVDPADAVAELRRALAFLGQPPVQPDAASPATLLAAATANWQPAGLPRRPAERAPDDGTGVG